MRIYGVTLRNWLSICLLRMQRHWRYSPCLQAVHRKEREMHVKTLQCDKVYHRDLGDIMEGTKFGWQCLEMI